jgi:hypothetical protein
MTPRLPAFSFVLLLALSACSTAPQSMVKHLGPTPEAGVAPKICKIVGVLPNSPATKAGIHTGEVIKSVNGALPADAVAVAELIQNSGSEAALEIADAAGKSRPVKVILNKDKPRLGASCDLTGWRKNSVSAAGNESVTTFQGPFALTASAIIDKDLTFMRVRLSNHSDHPLTVAPDMFAATDGTGAAMKLLSPSEVMYFMHGEDGVPLVVPPTPANGAPMPVMGVPADSSVRAMARPHKSKEDWSQSDNSFVQANAKYLNKESLWPVVVAPGEFADGLIYMLEPKTLPLKVQAQVETHALAASFGVPVPSTHQMTQDELAAFFEAQKKGTPIRLTLKKGKVFVGRYASYDSINETVWFDTPTGVLLTTSSFGLRTIAYAEAVSPEPQKKQPAEEPLN